MYSFVQFGFSILLLVHIHGILQFINVYLGGKDRVDEGMKWGDEVSCILRSFFDTLQIEFQVVQFDHEHHRVRLSLRAPEIMKQVEKIIEEEEYVNSEILVFVGLSGIFIFLTIV